MFGLRIGGGSVSFSRSRGPSIMAGGGPSVPAIFGRGAWAFLDYGHF